MATQAQIDANRQNAQKSTGPRTAEGKAAASQNAFKHGLFVKKAVIRDESQDEYDRHREALLAAQLDAQDYGLMLFNALFAGSILVLYP